MKVIHSIRWRIQAWHGLLLLVVLSGFGFTVHRFQEANAYRRVEGEIRVRLTSLLDALGRPPRGESANGPSTFRPEFRLDARRAAQFGEGTDGFYFVVWWRDGVVLASSTNAPKEIQRPEFGGVGARRTLSRQRGVYREMYERTPPGECLLVGRSIQPEQLELRQLGWWIAGLGGAVLAFGLLGGWVLAARVIRPLGDISAAAVRIAQGDLSHRINTAETDNELGELASVLNATFARLETAFQQQAQFTSDASHELRTPVTVILTQTQLALARERSPAEYRESLETCRRAAQRMRRLIETLLELARFDAGQESIRGQRIELSAVLADALDLVKPLADERGTGLQTQWTRTECIGDPERLGQVFTNLLTNAVVHQPPGGMVSAQCRVESGLAVVSIVDRGPGIPPEQLPKLFERFHRGDPSRAQQSGGTGLGLAISKAIVEAHGGSIRVQSVVGQGTTFEVRLPLGA